MANTRYFIINPDILRETQIPVPSREDWIQQSKLSSRRDEGRLPSVGIKNGHDLLHHLCYLEPNGYKLVLAGNQTENELIEILDKLKLTYLGKALPVYAMSVYDPVRYRDISFRQPHTDRYKKYGIRIASFGIRSDDHAQSALVALKVLLDIPDETCSMHPVLNHGSSPFSDQLCQAANTMGFQIITLPEIHTPRVHAPQKKQSASALMRVDYTDRNQDDPLHQTLPSHASPTQQIKYYLDQLYFITHQGGAEKGFAHRINEKLSILATLRGRFPHEHDALVNSNFDYRELFALFPDWQDLQDLQKTVFERRGDTDHGLIKSSYHAMPFVDCALFTPVISTLQRTNPLHELLNEKFNDLIKTLGMLKLAGEYIQQQAIYDDGTQLITLYHSLLRCLENFKKNIYSRYNQGQSYTIPQSQINEFKNEFIDSIHQYDRILIKYRSFWKALIINISLALTGIGLIFIAIKLIHSKISTNRFQFFYSHSNSEIVVAKLEKMVSILCDRDLPKAMSDIPSPKSSSDPNIAAAATL